MAVAAAADRAHVLVFPVPAQGHLNSFLHFSTGLLRAGLHVTFLHTDHSLRRLGAAAGEAAAASPRLRFLSVPDGLPDDDPRDADGIPRLLESMRTTAGAAYRDVLASLRRAGGTADGFPPVTCVVADGILPFAADIAEELGVPAIAYRTVSACAVLAYLSVPRLIESGELPFPEGADLDEPIRGVPGMESFLRRRDLPIQCRRLTKTHEDPLLNAVVAATVHSCKARALMLNTTTSLERSSLAHLAQEMRDVFAVGPLHAMSPAPAVATSLWRHDDGCMAWLDGQAEQSVVYISLGSLTVISHEQFTEFLLGLVATGYPFLWVLRPDMLGASQDAALQEAIAAVGEGRSCVVPWVPQRDVLRHRAVGCFLTHSGWNSTVEGVVEGVPMVCWPFFADQQVNSRFVGAVWGNGLDMKDVCERDVVERTVREAMESAEVRRSAGALAEQVERDIADDGSSALEFKRLVSFIRELSTFLVQASCSENSQPRKSMATPTVVLVPEWGAGHLMSLLDAGKRLLARAGSPLSLTVLVIRPPTEQLAAEVEGHVRREEASALDVRFVHLPAVEHPTDFVSFVEFVSRFAQMHAPHVRAAVAALPCPVAALVLDFFCTTLLDVSRDLAVPAYVYFTSNAAMLALMLRLPALHEEVTAEFEEMKGAVDVPGLPPVPPSSFPDPVKDKKSPNYTWFVYHGRRFAEADGIIVNTTAELEQSAVAAIADGRCTRGVHAPTVYPIGPVISFNPPPEQPHECVQWLDAQPPGSVVLLCFGSGGFFAAPRAHEIAHGLERSGHRFLWVLRGPPAPGARHPTDANLAELLPDGFLERTKDRGLVWPTWAPQREILAHAAVGGFVTHGGWNSVLESLWFGVPMAPWPLYAEQHLNALTLVAGMGVAVAMKVDRKQGNFVEAAELERAVKELMGGGEEGRKAREKAMEMKATCRNAVEEGGSSVVALQRLSEELYKGAVVNTDKRR
ncbi:7-deoxyloganetic acid glucosyltransferase [Dichanthelium oligosanthes]|uniref:Malvidin galactosylase UGT88C3 n=1 Tax=Dichanthelium oligosanthes TaxID=888268 RepID=A0A1E5V980_9POAL|nr:7-deoxyloganetic acid glucosyltransferase [Dichanthelium oligosanthes]